MKRYIVTREVSYFYSMEFEAENEKQAEEMALNTDLKAHGVDEIYEQELYVREFE